MITFELKGRNKSVAIGGGCPVIVNCNLGINAIAEFDSEKEKLDSLFIKEESSPDTIMDLSLLNGEYPIADYARIKYGVPIGLVPVYGLDYSFRSEQLIKQIKKHAEKGIAFMTMHFTADMDLYELAKQKRGIPVTSRGGKLILNNTIHRNHKDNILRENLDNIIALSLFYGFAISLGTTFRPAGICDACDSVHIEETQRQIELAKYLTEQGCKVIIENVGHIGIGKIEGHCKLLKQANVPIMPLGPVVLDSSIGSDHISASIGAAMMGYFNALNIINAITPSEHLHSKITFDDAEEGVKAAKIVAQSINCTRFPQYEEIEHRIYSGRSIAKNCVISGQICTRCAENCPLK